MQNFCIVELQKRNRNKITQQGKYFQLLFIHVVINVEKSKDFEPNKYLEEDIKDPELKKKKGRPANYKKRKMSFIEIPVKKLKN